jgi:photosystem II stability/assembly factor-like uncharacterized protein
MSGSPSGQRLYATGLRTGLWRSDNFGANWCQANTKVACPRPLTSPLVSPGVSQINEIAVSPTPADGSTALLATGDPDNSGFLKSYAGSVLYSSDAGRTWSQAYIPSCGKGSVVYQVRFAPDDPNTVFAARVVRWLTAPLASPPSYFGQTTPSGRPVVITARKPGGGGGYYVLFADATTVHVHDGLPPVDSPAEPNLGRWARVDGQNPAEGNAPLFIHADPLDLFVSNDFAATFALQPLCAASGRAACANRSLIHTAGRVFVANDGGVYASPAGRLRFCASTIGGLLTPGCNFSPFATKPAAGRGLGTLWMSGAATLSRPGAVRPAHYSGTQDNDYFYENPDAPPVTPWDTSCNPEPATNWTGETNTCGDCGRFMADSHPAAADRVLQVDHPRGSSSFGIFAANGRYPTAPYQWCVGSNAPGCTPAFGSRDIGGGSRFYSIPFATAPDGATSAPPIWGWGNRHVIQTLPAEVPTTTGTSAGCPVVADLVMLDFYEPYAGRPAPANVTLLRAQVIDVDRNTAACLTTPFTNRWGVVTSGLPADTAIVQPAGGHGRAVYYAWTRGGDLVRIAQVGNAWSPTKVVDTSAPGANGACAAASFFVNPYNARMVYIDDPGAPGCAGGIKMTANGGRNWTRVASLENLATVVGAPFGNSESRGAEAWFERDYGVGGLSALLTDMVFVADEPRTRFAAGGTGVFATQDGVNWRRLADDRDFGCRAVAAAFDKSTLAGRARSLYVTCYNRGMLRFDNIPDAFPESLTPTTNQN